MDDQLKAITRREALIAGAGTLGALAALPNGTLPALAYPTHTTTLTAPSDDEEWKKVAIAEIIVLPSEADAVARELREHDLFITALHNHELFIQPNAYYLHAFGTGAPLDLARAIRTGLNHTNSKFM